MDLLTTNMSQALQGSKNATPSTTRPKSRDFDCAAGGLDVTLWSDLKLRTFLYHGYALQ